MNLDRIPETLIASVIYSVTGIVTFLLAFWLVDKLTPGDLWKELVERRNTAVAQFFGFLALGMCIIIAACLHG